MGISRWSPEDWLKYSSGIAGKTASEIFGSMSCPSDLDPRNITYRESCDSSANPNSTPVIVAVDVTGSMGILAETLVREGLNVLLEEIYDRKPVSDPHVMCMAVGDAWCDRAPLQVSQFEADIRLAEQLSRFYIEKGGGGNQFESYNLPWYFAATRTKCDAFLKREKRGYVFTVGDEPPPPVLLAKHVKQFLGDTIQRDLSTRDLLKMVTKDWNVFHIMIEEGRYYRGFSKQTKDAWTSVLGQRAIGLSDHRKLAELIVSIIQVTEGADLTGVVESWSGSTALVVRQSLDHLPARASAGRFRVFRF